MGWRRARFKDADVWVEVDGGGQPAARGGRVPMRYSDKAGARVYHAGLSRLEVDPGSEIVELPDGQAADAPKAKASRGSGFGKAGTRTASQAAAAAADAERRIGEVGDDSAVAFTDGSCKGNPGPAGSGVFLRLPDGRVAEWARSLGRATNNIAELTAIEMALQLLDEADVPPDAPVAVFSDSSYARGVLTQGWKAKANQELIRGLRAHLAARPGVELHWVAGHVGVAGNERADQLANVGVTGRDEKRWVDAS